MTLMDLVRHVILTTGSHQNKNVSHVTPFKDVSNVRRATQEISLNVLNAIKTSPSSSSTSIKTQSNMFVNTTEETLRTVSLLMNQTPHHVSNVLKAILFRTMNVFQRSPTAKNQRTELVLNVFLGLNQ